LFVGQVVLRGMAFPKLKVRYNAPNDEHSKSIQRSNRGVA